MMKHERFRELAEAYGADLRRWPMEERGAAAALVKSFPAETRVALGDAVVLDKVLDSYRVLAPDAGLRERIVASAPIAQAVWQRARIWWQGAGFAALGVAGVLTGALLIAHLVPLVQPQFDDDNVYVATAFDGFTSELGN